MGNRELSQPIRELSVPGQFLTGGQICTEHRLCADMVVSDCATIRKLAVPRGLTLRQADVGYDEYYLYLIFPFYLNRDTSVLELFPVAVFQ